MMDYLTADWSGLLRTVVGAGIGSALIQGLLPIFRERWQRKSQAAFMAMRVSVLLEAYAADCYDLISYNLSAYHPPDDRYPNWGTKLPELADFPTDAEGWRALDPAQSTRCFGFRNKVRGSQVLINETIIINEGALGSTVEAEASQRGLEAWRLAVTLRQKHGLVAAETVWNFVEELERIEQRRINHRNPCANVVA